MRKFLLSLLVFSMVSLGWAATNHSGDMLPFSGKQHIAVLKDQVNVQRMAKAAGQEFPGGIIFYEDFEPESPWHRWTSVDLTYPPPERGDSHWILDTWEALGDSSWRMADTTFGTHGGYDNHWYQVLDTPPIMVTDTNAVFSFYHRYSLENPAGVDPPYDGWDGINVRVSIDSGFTWIVLPFSTYNVTSSWAFGHPDQGMFEGPGIASWAGTNDVWHKEEISLKNYVLSGKPIMLRFAFASDLAYSTNDGGPDMFGWEIDSILVASEDSTYFFNDGTKDGMVGKDNIFIPPVGGDLWHIATFDPAAQQVYLPDFAPSGVTAAVLQNGGDVYDTLETYNPWMEDAFQVGPISIPDTIPVYMDFTYLPDFFDMDNFPNDEYVYTQVRPVDSTNWEPGWYYQGYNIVNDFGYDKWIEFSYTAGYPTNMSPMDLSRFAGQDVYVRVIFKSDYDNPIGSGMLFDNFVVYAPIKTIPAVTGLRATPNRQDSTITVHWNMENGKSYQIWRTTPGDQYIHLMDEVYDSVWVDTAIVPFQEYDYTLKASVRYEGTSDFPRNDEGYILIAATEVIPPTIVSFYYDDGTQDTTVVADRNKLVLVKFTPKYYPVDLKGINIFLDSTGTHGTAAQFTVWDDDGDNGMPGTKLLYKNRSSLDYGFNRIIFDDSVAIDSGSFFIGYKRFGTGLVVGADTTAPIDSNTYLDTDSGYTQVTDRDAMIHVYLDTTRTITGISERDIHLATNFILGRNYPNPFNPTTTIPFVVPAKAAGQEVTLKVYNVLGQHVATLFTGKVTGGVHQVSWNGLNKSGKQVSSGIYIYQLKGKDVALNQRMLLIK